jgi:hypothetical protein
MQRLLGPTLGRFQSEFLNPLIERVFGLMLRAEAFEIAPDIIQGERVDVEFVGPLARSQRMEEAIAVEKLYALAGQVAQIDPSIIDNINHDQAIRMRAELLGVPKSVLRGEDEVGQIREQRAMQQQMQQEMMQQQQQAEIMKSQAEATRDATDPQVVDQMQNALEATEGEVQ